MPTPSVDPYAADKLRKSDQTVTRVTKACTLNPGEEDVVVVIPLGTADDYDVLLPPVGSCPGAKFTIVGERAAGSYSDGSVTVKGSDNDLGGAPYSSDPLTANGDYLCIENWAGKVWVEHAEKTST